MAAIELFCHLIDAIDLKKLSKEEISFLEIEVLIHLYMTINETYQAVSNLDKESIMIESKFIRFLIEDILDSGDYSIKGIACYTQIPLDIIVDICIGKNSNPSFMVVRKLIELHKSIKPYFYKEIIKKAFGIL